MSLRAMGLRDFVIVRSLDLEFQSGLSVLTGETGAGKSILIDALQLALGGRDIQVELVNEGKSFNVEAAKHNANLGWAIGAKPFSRTYLRLMRP